MLQSLPGNFVILILLLTYIKKKFQTVWIKPHSSFCLKLWHFVSVGMNTTAKAARQVMMRRGHWRGTNFRTKWWRLSGNGNLPPKRTASSTTYRTRAKCRRIKKTKSDKICTHSLCIRTVLGRNTWSEMSGLTIRTNSCNIWLCRQIFYTNSCFTFVYTM